MKQKLSLLAGLLGVFLLILAATLAWGGHSDTASAANPTPTVIATVVVGDEPLGIAVNQLTNAIYVGNRMDHSLSVIDGATNEEVGTPIPLVGTETQEVSVNQVTNHIYVINGIDGSTGSVSVIDGATNSPEGTPIPVGQDPRGIAVNVATNKVYVSNSGSGTLSVIDGETNSLVGTPIFLAGSPRGVAVNPGTNRIYVANYAGWVDVIDGVTNAVTQIACGSCLGVAVNPGTNRIYASFYDPSGSVVVIDGWSNQVVGAPIGVGSYPWGLAVDPVTHRIYVANSGGGSVSVIDGVTNTLLPAIPVGNQPWGVAVDPKSQRVYVTNFADDTVSVIQDYAPPVGGIAEHPQLEPAAASGAHGSSGPNNVALAGLAAGGALLLAAGGWYARRRWLT